MSVVPAAPRYRAFLSYSHGDRKEAAWAHRQLEGYRFPPGARTEEGLIPGRLAPVFRDREELRVGASLGDALQAALGEAECLVVLCSPRAARSRWVNEEITFFGQHLGRSDRVFALIVDGDPGAVPGGATDCFPPALRNAGGAELLAADLRRGGDGRRLALLKLIAGLARVRLDDLVRRDQQRSIRRLQGLAAAALALVLTFAGLGTALYFQRREAVRQRDLARLVRDQAQELNTFFITDLRSKLRPVGRLDLLDDVTRRVLAYHASLPAELADDPAVLRARAMAMDYAGQISLVRGDAADAVARLEASRDAWTALVRRGDGGAEAVQGFAVNCQMLGEAMRGRSASMREVEIYAAGLATLDTLKVKNAGGAARLARLRSLLRTATGKAFYRLGNSAGALEHLDAGAALAKAAVEGDPQARAGWVQAVSAFDELARYYLRVGDLSSALTQAVAAEQAADTLVQRDRDDADAWALLAGTQGVQLMVHAAGEDWPAAEKAARGQLAARQLVSQRDPQNPTAAAKLGTAHDDLAFTLSHQDDQVEAALEEFSRAVKVFTELILQYPSRNDWRHDLALIFKRRGDLAFQGEVWDLAGEDYERCRHLRARLVADSPADATALMGLANIQVALGEVAWKQGQFDAAAVAFAEAWERLQTPALAADHAEAAKLRRSIAAAVRELERVRGSAIPDKSPDRPPAAVGKKQVDPRTP